MSQTQLELILIGLAMCIIGAIRLFGYRRHHARASGTPIVRGEMADWWPKAHGVLLLMLGTLLVAATVVGGLVRQDSRAAAQAHATLDEVLTENRGATSRLEEAAARAISQDKPSGYQARAIAFAALRESPVCAAGVPRCAPGNPSRPVHEWEGQLTWEERRRLEGNWYGRVCPATVTLTAGGAWEVIIHQNRCNSPGP